MEELRKLRKPNDEVSSLRPSLRPCPFLAQDPLAEVEAGQEIEKGDERANTGVQNEPIAERPIEDNAAGASQIRAEYSPTPRSTDAPRAGHPCHDQTALRAGSQCHEVSVRSSQAVGILDPAASGSVPLRAER
jgi:hypothetical protein